MLTRVVVFCHGALIEIGLWIFPILAAVVGYKAGRLQDMMNGSGNADVSYAMLAVLTAFFIEVIVVGAVLVIIDLRNAVRSIEQTLATNAQSKAYSGALPPPPRHIERVPAVCKCGATIMPNEAFCGSCGARHFT